MARYGTELNTFLVTIDADAEAGTLGPSLTKSNFKNEGTYYRALAARMLQEVASAAMDQGITKKANGTAVACKFDGQKIMAALQQQIGSVNDVDLRVSAPYGSGGGSAG